MEDQHGAVASGAVPGSGRRGEPRRHAPRVHGVPSQRLDPAEPVTTCRGLVMDLSCTSRTRAPVTRRIARLRSPRVAAVRKAPRSADVDLAKESGAFHRRGSADGWARTIAIGSPATGPMCPQIKSPLLSSILLFRLVSYGIVQYRDVPFRTGRRTAALSARTGFCRAVPGLPSKHGANMGTGRSRPLRKMITMVDGRTAPSETRFSASHDP